MANKGLIGVQMSTIAPAKMPHFDAYESMGKLADIGYHCVEISQVDVYKRQVLYRADCLFCFCWGSVFRRALNQRKCS